MKIIKIIGVFLSVIIFAACDNILPEPTIDTASDESMEQTSLEVRESLPESEREKFDEALQLIAFSQIDFEDIFAQGTAGSEDIESKMKESLHGKTASQVIAEAGRITLEREARERQQALDEIAELEREQVVAEVAKEQLSKFEVVRSRFYQEEQQYLGNQPIIELTVMNGTDAAISRAYFEGTIASPNRSVPWHKDTFNYSISGGLEPGEEQSWRLVPNQFSGWGTVDVPDDAIFTAIVEKLDGPDGESLYSTTDFTDRDKERLSELKSKYNVQ